MCVEVRSRWCVTAMCLPSVMSYNLGTVFILQTCSSAHTVLLGAEFWIEASLPPTQQPSNKKMEALRARVCESVCVCMCVLKCSNQKSISSSDQNISLASGEMCRFDHRGRTCSFGLTFNLPALFRADNPLSLLIKLSKICFHSGLSD